MIHFPREGTPYKIGLNIKIFKPYFLKISFICPLPLCFKQTYTRIFEDIKYRGWKILYLNISYLRYWKGEDEITLQFYFQPLGKQKVVSTLEDKVISR